MDINKYAEMVSGVDFCETYADETKDGQQVVKATYMISAVRACTPRTGARIPPTASCLLSPTPPPPLVHSRPLRSCT